MGKTYCEIKGSIIKVLCIDGEKYINLYEEETGNNE
jgi:hypothetical protein